jgi:hypothetical protein
MRVLILGVDHDLQCKDPTGNFLRVLQERLRDSDVELIAEEATKLPTTVGQRLACRINVPWLNMDMDDAERKEAGIFDELNGRWFGPLMGDDDPDGSYASGYLPRADGLREEYWVSRVARQKVMSAIMVCGFMHLSPLAKKLRNCGCSVEELNVCGLDWYIANTGRWTLIEGVNGQRHSEFRPSIKKGVR